MEKSPGRGRRGLTPAGLVRSLSPSPGRCLFPARSENQTQFPPRPPQEDRPSDRPRRAFKANRVANVSSHSNPDPLDLHFPLKANRGRRLDRAPGIQSQRWSARRSRSAPRLSFQPDPPGERLAQELKPNFPGDHLKKTDPTIAHLKHSKPITSRTSPPLEPNRARPLDRAPGIQSQYGSGRPSRSALHRPGGHPDAETLPE